MVFATGKIGNVEIITLETRGKVLGKTRTLRKHRHAAAQSNVLGIQIADNVLVDDLFQISIEVLGGLRPSRKGIFGRGSALLVISSSSFAYAAIFGSVGAILIASWMTWLAS